MALIYVGVGRWLVRAAFPGRDAAFAVLNLAAVYLFFFVGLTVQYAILLGIVVVQFLALRAWCKGRGWVPWLAFLTPIAVLIVLRYGPEEPLSRFINGVVKSVLPGKHDVAVADLLFGISYLAFRASYLVLEVRNGVVPLPGFWQYIGFTLFAPTVSVGPISPYREHSRAFRDGDRPAIPVGIALLRVLVGAVKFRFLGAILNQLTYAGLLRDGNPHLWVDFPIAAVAYYLFLYCNFSGFCDMAIGGAGLMGIPVAENFDQPLAARNPKDFWNRWHITLSLYMRDVVFSPLSKWLVGRAGPKRANDAIAVTIVVVFLLVGIWHGVGWHFAAFGACHAAGVAGNHYYTLALKRRLGREGFAAYNRNRAIHAVAVGLNFVFVAATLFLFANDWDAMTTIFAALRWR